MTTELEPRTYRVTRADLVAYAAASGDPNPIHQDEDVARAVGLPGVIAHGMYTLALAARYVDEWAGRSGRIVELGAKFTRPVVVPAGEEGAEVSVSGVLHTDEDGVETVALTVTCDGQKVLGNPRAVLRA
ncbi:MaoC/PaaZ C-terminal domain-containing protein [Nocardioides sp. SYSU D00038]|uniref:MaoC/PaaZ C-terminal domain-containing protein n=1 Tax=Nocardioides sp. SYSU D00038 TaxID=2812554 RepID=UPI001967AE45|nr:MaoC/PaaZ C-terminal domain-containing protein [Nocardioides sp. SYSU D00038]